MAMDGRLTDACLSGDVAALTRLLEEDPLILDTAAVSPSILHGPLHIAALRGHVDVVQELLRAKPELAHERNAHGSYPLHLATANGHCQVVGELLKANPDLCLLRDGHGHLPLHTAVLKGRSDVMKTLIGANKESARELTSHGESVLHLAVRSINSEIFRYLVENLDLGEDKGFLNLKDEGGNTVLHLATARSQRGAVEFLTNIPGVEVNAANGRQATAVDVLREPPCPEEGDLLLGNIPSAAGGRATRHGNAEQPGNDNGSSNSPAAPATGTNPEEWFRCINTSGVAVAMMMATLSYQAILQPPGGFTPAGKAVLAGSSAFTVFTAVNTGIFFASTSLVLLPLCAPLHRRTQLMTTVLAWSMRIAGFCTLLTYSFAALAISSDGGGALCFVFAAWVVLILQIIVVWMPPNGFDSTGLGVCFPRRIKAVAESRDNLSHSIKVDTAPRLASSSSVVGGMHTAQAPRAQVFDVVCGAA